MTGPIETARSRSYERMSLVMWWTGWMLVALSIGTALYVFAYDYLFAYGAP
jgi:hypothetical protein